MLRTLRATKRNPINLAAAQEMFDYVSAEGGLVLVEWDSGSGKKSRFIARLATGPVDCDGQRCITIRDLRRPDGSEIPKLAGQDITVPLSQIRTLGYVGEEEKDESITEAKFQYRFLSPDFRSTFQHNGKEYPSLIAALADIATRPDAYKTGLIEPGDIPTAAFLRAGWFEPGVKPPQPSTATLKSVLDLVNARFSNPAVRRMLVSTGSRPFALPENAGGAFMGVNLNDMYTRVRNIAVDSGVQPTGSLPSRTQVGTLPLEAKFGSSQEQEFLEESRAAFEEARLLFERQIASRVGLTFEFVDVRTDNIRFDGPQPYQGLIYVTTMDRDRTAETLRLLRARLPFDVRIVSQPKNPTNVESLSADLAKWIVGHPEWEFIAVAHGIPDPTTPVFISALKARITAPATLDIAKAQIESGALDREGNLLLPVGGVLVGMTPRASDYVLTFERPATSIALLDKSAELTTKCAGISGVLNSETVKFFAAVYNLTQQMLYLTGPAQVIPFSPDVQVPAVAAPRTAPIEEDESEYEEYDGVSPLEDPGTAPSSSAPTTASVESVTTTVAQIALPSGALTPKMQASENLHLMTRVLAAMKGLKDNAGYILQVAEWAKRADAMLRTEDLNLLERAKIYVESIRKAGVVLDTTLERIDALKRAMILVRKAVQDAAATRSDPAVSFTQAAAGCSLIINEFNELTSKRAVTTGRQLVVSTYQNLNPDIRSESDTQIVRGLKEFAPTMTPGGYYTLSGASRELVAHEQILVPLATPPQGYNLGQEYQVGDIIQLGGESKLRSRSSKEEVAGTGFLMIRQTQPVNVAPIRVSYYQFDKGARLTRREDIAKQYSEFKVFFRPFMAQAWDIQERMGDDGKKELLEEISQGLDKKEGGRNYIREAEAERKQTRKRLIEKTIEERGDEEVGQKEVDAIVKAINDETKFAGANIVRDPVLYVLMIDEKTGNVHYPPEVNLTNWGIGMVGLREPDDAEDIKKLQMSAKFMSQFPLDTHGLDFMKTATKAEAEAVVKYLLPIAQKKDEKGNTVGGIAPFPWRPARFRKSKQMRSDIKGIRDSVEALRHITARQAATSPSSSRQGGFGTVSLRRGAKTAGTGLTGTLGTGTVTGRGMMEGGSVFQVRMPRAKQGEAVGDFYLKGDLTRLRRYFQDLVNASRRSGSFSAVLTRDLIGQRSQILDEYRTPVAGERPTLEQAEASFRAAYEDMQELKEQLENLDIKTLERLQDEGGEFIDDSGATQYLSADEVKAAYRASQNLADLDAIKAELVKREAAALEETWQRVESGASNIERFFVKFRRAPTQEEIGRMAQAALEGIDLADVFTHDEKTKRNPMKYDKRRRPSRHNPTRIEDIDLDDLEAAAAEEAEVPPSPAPTASGGGAGTVPPPPPREPEAEPEEPRRSTGDSGAAAARARALSSTSRLGGLRSAFSAPDREVLFSQTRVEDLRNETKDAWENFNEALYDSKQTKESLTPLLDTYLNAAARLQSALDERDKDFLTKNGPEALRELLRSEAFSALAKAQAAYTRAPRGVEESPGSKKPSARARLTEARSASNSIDPYGRPLAPPSPEKLASRGLSPFDLATDRARDLKDKSRQLPAPMNYAQLIEAAKLASDAMKVKPHGVSVGAISCRVMGDEPGVRQKLDRELIVRLLNSATYTGDFRGRRMGRPQPNANKVDWNRVMFVWLSPDSDHAVIFVNNVGTCEFHSAKFPELLSAVTRYIVDWFSDPRTALDREGYSVFIGRSGHDRIFQLWGQWPIEEGRAPTEHDEGRPTILELIERIEAFGFFDSKKESEFVPIGKGDLPRWLQNLSFYWVNERSAVQLGFESLEAYLTAEAEAYREALGAVRRGRPATESYDILRSQTEGERAAHAGAVAIDVKAAMEGTRKAVTLFYPELYNAEGENLSANEGTPDAIYSQLRAVAESVPDGGLIHVVDLSLFRQQTRPGILLAPKTRPVSSVRTGIKGIVPTPHRTLAELMKDKPNALIKVVLPPDRDIQSNVAAFFPEYDEGPVVEPMFVGSAFGIAALAERDAIAPGSSVILWNDPDVPDEARQFGRSEGIRVMATVLAQFIGFIKRIYLETGSYEVEAKMAEDPKATRDNLEVALEQMDEVTATLIRSHYFEGRSLMDLAKEMREQGAEAVLPDGTVVPVRKENVETVIREGVREMRRIINEAGIAEPKRFKQRAFVPPDLFRRELVSALADQLKSAGAASELRTAALGVPKALREKIKARVGFGNPEAAAEELLNEIARAYQVDPALYVSQGNRGTKKSSDSILLNRGARSNTNRRTKMYGTKVRR